MMKKTILAVAALFALPVLLLSCESEAPGYIYQDSRTGMWYRVRYTTNSNSGGGYYANSNSGGGYYATCSRCGGSGSVSYKVTTYREMDRYDRMAEDSLRSSSLGFLVRRHKKVGSTVSDVPDGYKWDGESTRSETCSNCGGSGQVWISN